MITLVKTPDHVKSVSPPITSRWLATESPNNFTLLRHDHDIVTASNNSGKLRLTVSANTFDGQVGDQITVFNKSLNAMFAGMVETGSDTTTVETSIPYQAGFDPSDPALDPNRTITYINNYTQRQGYYFEGRLTINGVVNPLTIIASPDSFGYADLDVSGILRITTTIGKTGDYSELVMAETNKSGNFSLEYRECWYGSDNAWIPAGGSPPPLWYYAEYVRSEEQGSNLHEYVADDANDAPFLNLFEKPVYFRGLPFDLSFILPERPLLSPGGELTVTITAYTAANVILSQSVTNVPANALEGHVCSLRIAPEAIPSNASYFTAEITAP